VGNLELVKGIGLPLVGHQFKGHKWPVKKPNLFHCQKGLRELGPKGSNPLFRLFNSNRLVPISVRKTRSTASLFVLCGGAIRRHLHAVCGDVPHLCTSLPLAPAQCAAYRQCYALTYTANCPALLQCQRSGRYVTATPHGGVQRIQTVERFGETFCEEERI
jgi:hypothetical protein